MQSRGGPHTSRETYTVRRTSVKHTHIGEEKEEEEEEEEEEEQVFEGWRGRKLEAQGGETYTQYVAHQ
eukprot:5484590-Pyramimonas_sp.AAC.1